MKKTFQIVAETVAGKATIRIADTIAGGTETGAANIRGIVDGFITQGVTEAAVYINSGGGDVFEAVEIANQLKRFTKVTVNIGALAASAATYLSSSFHSVANRNTNMMIHKPSLLTSGTIEQIEAELKLLNNVTDDYRRTYATKTGKTERDIEAMWEKGDYWMTAEEALKSGFINAINEANDIERPGLTAQFTTSTGPKFKMSAQGYYDNWTLDDYLDKDPEAYQRMRKDHPGLAKVLEANYFGTSVTASTANEAVLLSDSRSNWTLDDYLDKDPKAYEKMKAENPAMVKRLENEYFGKR